MKVEPFMLIGASVLASVRSAAELAARDWTADWGLAADAVTLGARRACESSVPETTGAWSCFASQGQHVYVGWHPDSTAVLQELMFAPDAVHAPAFADVAQLAPAAARAAIDALACALASSLLGSAGSTPAACQAPEAAHYRRGGGAVVLSVAIGRQQSCLVLDQACVRRLAGQATVAALPALAKVDIQRELSDTGVILDLNVGTARVGLGSLMTLAIGDVIRLNAPVEQPISLSLPSGVPVLNGYLGKVGTQLAVELIR